MKGLKWVDDLKLRASTGYTGTQNIGDNMFYTLYSPYAYGGKSAMVPTQLGNEAIRWESTLQKDAGLDISLFNSKFGASIEIYEKATSGILFTRAVAGSSSYRSVIANLANIRNRGLEIALRGTFLEKKNFSWNGAFNISFNRSLVTNVNRDFTNPNDITDYNLGNAIVREGEPLGLIYGKVFTGLLQTQEQVDAYKGKISIGCILTLIWELVIQVIKFQKVNFFLKMKSLDVQNLSFTVVTPIVYPIKDSV
ncbi:TonB-dependent receptor [Sphingobacterium sp. E70]|uniref:TonB-dependent receptor domain-containing protein n=1 Tax=Sphingobacterium sp. E70 TaxID=2853439 RepID=UPI00211CB3CA|nr:TonB-dependent receptor [Sphingobacterium sp. E70]ULT23754.1 TonB-dependent receptor [Sphingobacterium sp. E70]